MVGRLCSSRNSDGLHRHFGGAYYIIVEWHIMSYCLLIQIANFFKNDEALIASCIHSPRGAC